MLLLLALLLPGPDQDGARALAEKLRSESVAEREEAAQALKKLGKDATPALEAASKDSDAEVAQQARRILRAIEALGVLTPEFRAAFPGVEDRLASAESEWTPVFLTACAKDLPRSALQPLAARALREASTVESIRAVLQAIGRRALHAAGPEVLRLLQEDRLGLRAEALSLACDLDCPGLVVELLKLLPEVPAFHRPAIIGVLGSLLNRKALPVLAPLLDDADQEIRQAAYLALATLDDRRVAPRVLEELKRATSWVEFYGAGRRAVQFELKEAVPILLERASTFKTDQRYSAACFLLELGAKEEGLALVRPFLDSKDERYREGAASLLARYGGPACGGEVARHLGHRDPGTRTHAIVLLTELGAKDQLDAIAPLAEDGLQPGGDARKTIEVRSYALEALAALSGQDRLPAIEKALGDPDGLVRGFAVRLLGRMGVKEKAPKIAELLGERHWVVQSYAAEALAALGEKERAPAIAKLLQAPDVEVRKAAVRALHALEALPPGPAVAAAVFANLEPYQVQGAAETLCRAGISEGVPKLLVLCSDVRLRLQEPPTNAMRWVSAKSLAVLNGVREPAAWKRLTSTPAPEKLEGTRREIIERLAKEAGLAVDWSARSDWADDGWMSGRFLLEGKGKSVFDVLHPHLTANQSQPWPARYDFIVVNGRLRVLPYVAAIDAWEAWWAARGR